MFARINLCLQRQNLRPWSLVAYGRTMSTVKAQDRANPKIDDDGKDKDICDYEISEDAQLKIKDRDGKNIRPIDVNPWNQHSNVVEDASEKSQATEIETPTAEAAK